MLTGLYILKHNSNSLGPAGAITLAPSLTVLTGLRLLDLMDNELGSDEKTSLTQSFKVLSQISFFQGL